MTLFRQVFTQTCQVGDRSQITWDSRPRQELKCQIQSLQISDTIIEEIEGLQCMISVNSTCRSVTLFCDLEILLCTISGTLEDENLKNAELPSTFT